MKYQYLTGIINLIATSEERSVRLGFYHQLGGAYTALFMAHAITSFEFTFYAEVSRFILDEIFE